MIACGEKASERFRILPSVSNLLADASTDRPVNIFHIAFSTIGKKRNAFALFFRESSRDTPSVERRISAASNTGVLE
jgi:hypothetical protein